MAIKSNKKKFEGDFLISKIKIKSDATEIEYLIGTKDKGNQGKAKLDGQHGTIYSALQCFLIHSLSICCLDEEAWGENGWVSGLTIKHDDYGLKSGLLITCQMGNEWGHNVVVNTPLLPEDFINDYRDLIAEVEAIAQKIVVDNLEQASKAPVQLSLLNGGKSA